MNNVYLWALMLSTGDVYPCDTGLENVMEIHAVYTTRKRAREEAKIFKDQYICKIQKVELEA